MNSVSMQKTYMVEAILVMVPALSRPKTLARKLSRRNNMKVFMLLEVCILNVVAGYNCRFRLLCTPNRYLKFSPSKEITD